MNSRLPQTTRIGEAAVNNINIFSKVIKNTATILRGKA